MERARQKGQLATAITVLTGKSRTMVSLEDTVTSQTQSLDGEGAPPRDPTPAEVAAILRDHFSAWYRAPDPALIPEHGERPPWEVAEDPTAFIARVTPPDAPPSYPLDIVEHLRTALTVVPGSERVRHDLTLQFQEPPSFEEFAAALASYSHGKAGGVTGLSYTMAKHWPELVKRRAYEALVQVWTDRSVPEFWRWRWLIPIPKTPEPSLQDLRPIMLLEVLRKTWTGIVIRRIMDVIEAQGVLSSCQHAFRKSRGTDSASLALRNAIEQAKSLSQDIYLASWDTKRAFDSVAKSLRTFAWKRLGVPDHIAEWLTALDENSITIVRSDFTFDCWCAEGYDGLRSLTASGAPVAFCPERGTGQGDVSSPATWIAIFDIVLRTLEAASFPEEGVPVALPSGTLTAAPDIAYADDLISPAGSLRGLQRKATIVSVCMGVLGLEVATHKLRVRKQCWGNRGNMHRPERITLHTQRWEPVAIAVRHSEAFRFLGVDYCLDGRERAQFERTLASLRGILAVVHSRRASAETAIAVIRSSTISKIAYIGSLAPWPLAWYQEFDTLLAREYRHRTKNMATAQRANLFIPPETGGLGLPSLVDTIQGRKRSILDRAMEGDVLTRLAVDSCVRRAVGENGPVGGLWASSVLEWGVLGGSSLRWTPDMPVELPLDLDVALVTPGTSWRIVRPQSWLRDQTRAYIVEEVTGGLLRVRLGEIEDGNPRGLPEFWLTSLSHPRRQPRIYTFHELFEGAEVTLLRLGYPQVFNPRPGRLRSAKVGRRLLSTSVVVPHLRLAEDRESDDGNDPAPDSWTCLVSQIRCRVGTDMFSRLLHEPAWRVGGQLLTGHEGERFSWDAHTYLCEDMTHVLAPSPLLLILGLTLRALRDGVRRGGPGRIVINNPGLVRVLQSHDRRRTWDSSQAGSLKRQIRRELESHPDIELISHKCPALDRVPKDTWSFLDRVSHVGSRILQENGDPETWVLDGGRVPRHMHSLGDLLPAHHLTPQWAWLESPTGSFSLRDDQKARHEATRLEAAELRDNRRARCGRPLKWRDLPVRFAATSADMPKLGMPHRAQWERILFDRHFTVGSNRAKAVSPEDPHHTELESCTLCGEPDSREHWILLCVCPDLRECRERHFTHLLMWGTDQGPDALALTRAVLHSCRALGGVEAILGCWTEPYISCLRDRAPELTEAEFGRLMPIIQRKLLHMVREIWHQRSALLRPRRQPVTPGPIPAPPPEASRAAPTDLFRQTRTPRRYSRKLRCYAVREGVKVGIFEDFREAQGYTQRYKGAEWKGFDSMQAAREYLAEVRLSPEQRLQQDIAREREGRTLVIYTDGSATRAPATAGWGWVALDPGTATRPHHQREILDERCGPVVLTATAPDYMGAFRATNNTGELSAIGHALQWAGTWPLLHLVEDIHIRTDSQWSQRVLLGGRVKANKALVLQVRGILARLGEIKRTTIGWVRGHQQDGSEVAFWNKRADWLAANGRRDGLIQGEREQGTSGVLDGRREGPWGHNEFREQDDTVARSGIG